MEKVVINDIEFSVGDKVEVIAGPFNSFTGTIKGTNSGKSKFIVSVNVFGRPTDVEFYPAQIDNVDME